jgi:glutathione peroxidase
LENPVLDTQVKSVYDIPLLSWDGQEDFLAKYKGKVTLVVNVTADCGNAPQLETLETLYQKYKDQGFEIAAIPTNDFCGPGITYNQYEESGISCGADARDYALNKYSVNFEFSELVVSRPHPVWREKRNNNGETHELFAHLTAESNEDMGGNFEKFLVDREGKLVKRFHNYMLLDFYKNNVEEGITPEMEHQDVPPLSKEEAFEYICSEIEKVL